MHPNQFGIINYYQIASIVILIVCEVPKVTTNCVRKCCPKNSVLSLLEDRRGCVEVKESQQFPFTDVCSSNNRFCGKNQSVFTFHSEEFEIFDNKSLWQNASRLQFFPQDYCLDFVETVNSSLVAIVCQEVTNTKRGNPFLTSIGENDTLSKANRTADYQLDDCPENFCIGQLPITAFEDQFTIVESSVIYHSFFENYRFSSEDVCMLDSKTLQICAIRKNTLDFCIHKCCPHNSIMSSTTRDCLSFGAKVKLNFTNVCEKTRRNCENQVNAEIPQHSMMILEDQQYSLKYTFGKTSVIFPVQKYCLDYLDDLNHLVGFLCVTPPKNQDFLNKTHATGNL